MRSLIVLIYFILGLLLITVKVSGSEVRGWSHGFPSTVYTENTFSFALAGKSDIEFSTELMLPIDTPKVQSLPSDTSEDGTFDAKVTYDAEDSMRFDLQQQKVYLYGKATVTYKSLSLTAGYMELDIVKNTVFARGTIDSTGAEKDLPLFKEGDQEFTSHEMRYNFKTKKGLIKEVITHEGEGYIHGERVKKDSTNVVYIRNGKYTTCDLNHPHFYIAASKLKVIQNDKIVTGPANLVVADIPTPLGVPFGFFPNKKGRSSGIIIPAYGESAQYGFFLKNGGFYWGAGEYFDVALTGDIYTYGSYAAHLSTNYNRRYKYNGNFSLNVANMRLGERNLPGSSQRKDFMIGWRHTQDAKAYPGHSFSASVQAGSSKFNKYNSVITSDYLQNIMQSQINYSRYWEGMPFNFSVGANHSQNTSSRMVTVRFPSVVFNVNRLTPFSDATRTTPRWFDKLTIGFSSNANNDVTIKDSLLFNKETLISVDAQKAMRTSGSFNVPVSLSLPVFKYFSLNTNVTGNSKWQLVTYERRWDTIQDTLLTDRIERLRATYDWNAAASLNTNVYGTYQFKRGAVKAIRHMITPSIGFNYRPDFSKESGTGYRTVQVDSMGRMKTYSVFDGASASIRSGSIVGGIYNTLEMKVKTKNDSGEVVDKKVMLIQAMSINSSYNLAADSFQLADINMDARTTLFKAINVAVVGVMTPYCTAPDGRRINKFLFDSTGKVGAITSANLNLSTDFSSQQLNGKKKVAVNPSASQVGTIYNPYGFVDFDVPWAVSISYNLTYQRQRQTDYENQAYRTKPFTQSIMFRGELSLTKKWKISASSGYDFIARNLTLTSLDIHRDLHCWEMHFNWIPIGLRKSYVLRINVKSSILQDLKLQRQKQWFDNQGQDIGAY